MPNYPIDSVSRNLEEILTEDELRQALASVDSTHSTSAQGGEKNRTTGSPQGKKLKHYIGFEISGKIHLGTGIVVMGKVKDLMDAGIETTIFLADWHTFINEKLGGADFETIQRVAVGYFKEGLKTAFQCVGGDPEKLNFVLGSELYAKMPDYWETVIRVARETTLSRAKRSVDIMGRVASEEMPVATLFYPMMQAADIFALGVDIAHGGTDQRKAHVIARDVAPAFGWPKPIALHHHLVQGLGKPPVWPIPEGKEREMKIAMKMSKSKPDSAVFIHDSPDEIRAKIKKAFCPPNEIIYNPMLDWVKHVLFLGGEGELAIKRSAEHGGDLTLNSEELPNVYASGTIHPEDLKNAVAERLIEMLEPARKHFAQGPAREALGELEKLIG